MATAILRPDGDGYLTEWLNPSGGNHYLQVDEASPDDAVTVIAHPAVANVTPFLRLSSTNGLGTLTALVNNTWTTHSEVIAKPGGGSWTYTDLASLEVGIIGDATVDVYDSFTLSAWGEGDVTINSVTVYFRGMKTLGKLAEGYITQIYVQVDYSAAATDEAPTSLECDRQTNPTGVGDTPIFTALYQAEGDSGTADRYKIEVDDNSDFASPKWQSGEQTLSPTCTDGQRCTEIAYGGTSLQSDVTYYWRIQLYQSGRTPTWSTGTNTFAGVNRDWEDAEYPVRRKLTVNADHDGIASGELLSFDFETGKRIILASDGCFDEAIQASGGFSIARHAGRTHIAYLSKLESVDAKLGIRIVTLNAITGEQGTSHYIDTSGSTYDTHFFPTLDVTPDGYLHCFYGAHGGSYRYRRSKYPNESGSLSTDHTDAAMWVRADTGADAYMTISGFTGTYAIPFHIASGNDAGRLYCFCRSGTSYRYIFVYSDNSGVSWSAVHTMIDDTSASHYRVYMYGVRFDRKEQRLHISWTHNHAGDVEKGIWYAYCDYDETDGSSLDVGLNIWRWADGTLAGRTKTTGAQAPIDYTLAEAITTSASELSKVFTETLVIDKNGDPVVFWEQKFNQGTNLWAHQTNLMCARWSGSAWVIYCISDQVNTKLRVRRSSVAIGLDKDGVIHAIMPVASKTQWRQLATGDDDDVGVTLASGTDNYAMIDDGFSRIDQATWLKMSAVGSKASFTHGTSNADDINKIFSVEVVAFAKSTGSASSIKLYLDDGTSSDLATAQTISTSAITRYTKEWTTNPFTAAAWASGDIAGLRFGVQCESTNEVQIWSVFMRFTFMRSTDENLGAAELHELTSSDNGVTWQIQERSRNSMIGVPMMNHPHHLTGDVFQAIWTSGHDVFYYSNERFGLMLPTGLDVRILHGATEIDRVATYWNLNKSRISFKAQEAITAGKIAGASDYYLEYGNRNADNDVQGAPADVWQGFWNFEEMAEGDSIGTHADWTLVSGTASVYSSLTNHRNKVYAGNHAIKSLTHAFEAYTIIGVNVADVFIEAGIWLQASLNYSYIAARDGTTEFRVGVNQGTNRPAYYDGSWHDVTTAGYADRANMNNFAILVTSKGCSAWVNGTRICEEVSCITVVDQIRIGSAGESYFDLIRWSKRPYATEDYTTTTGFDKAMGVYSSNHTATKETADSYHNIPSTPWQKSRITRVDVTVDVRNTQTFENDFTIDTHCWIGGTSPYDSSDTVDDGTHVHTGINSGSAWQGSHTYSFTDLDLGPKSVKVDCYACSVTDEPTKTDVRITQIKIWTEDRDPIIVIGDEEWRGFRMDATLQGSGQIQFFMDANINAAYRRNPLPVRMAHTGGVEMRHATMIESLAQITPNGRVVIEAGRLLDTHAQCILEGLRGLVDRVVAPLEYAGQPAAIMQTAIGHVAGLSTVGQVCLDYGGLINTNVLTALEYNTSIDADGQFIIDYAGQAAVQGAVVIESLHRIDTELAVPAEFLSSMITHGQGLVEFGKGLAGQQQVCLAYVGSFSAAGVFVIDHLAMLKLRRLANIEHGLRTQVRGLVPFGHGQGLDGRAILPIAFLGSAQMVSQALVEWSKIAQPMTPQIVFDSGRAIASHGQLAIENLGALLTDVITPVEWQGGVAVSAEGLFPVEWGGGVSITAPAMIESRGGFSDDIVLRLEFVGAFKTDQKLVWSNLALLEAPQAALIEAGEGVAVKASTLLEWGRGLQSQGKAAINWMTAMQIVQQLIAGWSAWTTTQARAGIEWTGTMVPLELRTAFEYGEGGTMQLQTPTEWLTGRKTVQQTVIEFTGGQVVTVPGAFPIEWTLKVDTSGVVHFDYGQRSLINAITPIDIMSGLSTSGKIPIAVDQLAKVIHQVSIEYLARLERIGQVNFDYGRLAQGEIQASLEYGVKLLTDGIMPMEWLGATVMTTFGQLPISWRSSLVANQRAGIEYVKGLEIIHGQVLIDWGASTSAIVGQVSIEWGQGTRVIAQYLADWLGTVGAYGRISFENRGYMTPMIMVADIEWGKGLTTRTQIPIEYGFSLVASGQLPIDWLGFAITMFTVAWAEARIPGIVGAAAQLPGVREAMAKLSEAESATARTAAAANALAKIIDAMDSENLGGV